MTLSALPARLQDPANWKGTDLDWWGQRWILKIHHWFAFGPRAKEWWARWRECPETILALKGRGVFRIEFTDGSKPDSIITSPFLLDDRFGAYYLSAIQYWCRWSFQFQWPFFISIHYYFKDEFIPKIGERAVNHKGKLFYLRFGARRDSDRVYWFPSIFIGLAWN
jgi:hypothetical protein